NAIGFVAFALADAHAEDGAAPTYQVQRRGGLRRDRGIAATGVGDAHAEAYPRKAAAGREMPEQCPWLETGVDLRREFCDTDVLWCVNRPREQRVEMIAYPERIKTGRGGSQVV